MKHKNNIGILVKPSYTSTLITFIIVANIVITTFWSNFKHYQLSQQLVDGFDEVVKTISQASGSKDAFINSFFGSTQFNQGLYIVMWASVGILVYFMIVFLMKGMGSIGEVLSIRNRLNIDKKLAFHEVVTRTIFRLLVICLTYIYLVILIQILIPVSVLCIKAGVNLKSASDLLYVFMGVLILVLSLHLVTILLRLIFLRVRVFGGSQELILES